MPRRHRRRRPLGAPGRHRLPALLRGAGLLVSMASRAWSHGQLRTRVVPPTGASVALDAALDMGMEKVALFLVTVLDSPPGGGPATEYLLLTAALASWAKVT